MTFVQKPIIFLSWNKVKFATLYFLFVSDSAVLANELLRAEIYEQLQSFMYNAFATIDCNGRKI